VGSEKVKESLKIPAEIVAGGKSTIDENMEEISKSYTNGRYHLIPNYGHFICMENPSLTADLILSFLSPSHSNLEHNRILNKL